MNLSLILKDFKYFRVAISNYSKIIFVVYFKEEIVNFMNSYKNSIPIIACFSCESLLLKLKDIDDIPLLNTFEIKSEVMANLRLS
jgi:hypothetical protein